MEAYREMTSAMASLLSAVEQARSGMDVEDAPAEPAQSGMDVEPDGPQG